MELPLFVFQARGVAAVRRLEKPAKDQTRQTRGSPTYSRHNGNTALKERGIMSCGVILRVFQTRSLMRQRPNQPIHPISDPQPSKPVGKLPPNHAFVGAAVGCDLLMFKHQAQTIAAGGRACRFRDVLKISWRRGLRRGCRLTRRRPVLLGAPPIFPAAIRASTPPRS
jgi:hypothetical protein